MLVLTISLVHFILIRSERISPISQPMPPGIPRARAPFPYKRAAPAHDPIIYAKANGMSLETDEEGTYRIGGMAQEGYESLYFDPSATAGPVGPETKKRHSRSSEAISQEIEDKIHRDSTRVTLSFEPEGSGDDGQVIMDTVLEIVPDNDAELQFAEGSPFVGNFDGHAAWKREKLKKLQPSAKFSSKKPIIVSRKSEKIVQPLPAKRLPVVGKENTVRSPETKKRHSRSSEAISQEIEDKIHRDSTRVTLSFEPEGSGDDGQVIMDTVLEIVPDNDAELQFAEGSPFVGNFDGHAAWKREKLKKLQPSAKFSSKKPIIVSRKSEKIVQPLPAKRLPVVGKENTVRIPSDRLLIKNPAKKIPFARKLRRSQYESTAVLSSHPETLIIMGANEFRGRSMRALRQGRGSWNRSRLSRLATHQRKANIWKKMLENKGIRRSLRKTRDQ